MKDKEEFFFAPSENVEGKKDKKLWYWEECMKIAAESGAKLGSLVFWTVYKISVYEEHGKFDFCTAGPARLAEDLGVSEKQIRWALQRACSASIWQGGEKKPKKQQLYHIFCSQRVYRNKTDIYVTKHWLEKHNIESDGISILSHNRRPEQMLDKKKGRYEVLPVEGELVQKSVVLDDEGASGTTPKNVVFDETTPKSVDTTPKSVVSIEVDPNRNKSKEISESLNKSNLSSKEDNGEECDLEKSSLYVLEADFNEFWAEYPRKADKKKAYETYAKVRNDKKNPVTKEEILDGVKRYKELIERQNTEKRYIKMAQGWLNGRRWEDEYETQDPKQPANEQIDGKDTTGWGTGF